MLAAHARTKVHVLAVARPPRHTTQGWHVLQCRLHMQGIPGGEGAGSKKIDGKAQETATPVHKAKRQHSPNPHTAKAAAPTAAADTNEYERRMQ